MAPFLSRLLDRFLGASTEKLPGPVVPLLATAMPGIDVSHLQGPINWRQVAEAGISFAFAKATEGISLVDPQFSSNWLGMKDAGILRGAYHFFHPAKSLDAQVDNFVSTVGEIGDKDLPPVLDLEEVITAGGDEWQQIPAEQRVPLALSWLQAVENRLGRRPIVYTRLGFVSSELPNSEPLGQYPLWIAHYTTQPEPSMPSIWSNWTFWQYSEAGSVNGISGPVDLDRFKGSSPDLMALAAVGTHAGGQVAMMCREGIYCRISIL